MFSFVEISTSNAFFGVNVREVANSEKNHPLNVSRPRCVLSPLCVRLPYTRATQNFVAINAHDPFTSYLMM